MVVAVSVTTPNGAVELRAGDQVGGWTVVGPIGSGGSASVYRARPSGQSQDGSSIGATSAVTNAVTSAARGAIADVVALRICRPTDRRHLEAIVATYQHTPVDPNVIEVYETFVHRSQGHEHVVSITELSEDGTLEEQLVNGLLTEGDARILAEHLIAGLDAYHRVGEVHGDVKPSNIMRFGDRWKLVDPSATEHTAGSTTSVVTHERTLRYVAPEALDTPGRTRRAGDVWALGVTLHEALTGASPFDSMADQVVANCRIDSSVPHDLAHLIETCVAPFESRVKTAGSLRNLPPVADSARPLLVRRGTMFAAAFAAAFAVVAAVGLAASVLWPRSTSSNDSAPVAAEDGSGQTTIRPGSDSDQPQLSVTATSNPVSSEPVSSEPVSSGSASSTDASILAPGSVPDVLWQGQVESDFEDGAEAVAGRFVSVTAAPAPSVRVDAGGDARLEVGSNNRSDTYYLTAEGTQDPVLAGSELSIAADVRMAYYTSDEFGIDGPVHGFVLKTIPSDDGSVPDAYVVSVVPSDQGMRLRVGVTERGVEGGEQYQYRGPVDGHAAMGEKLLFADIVGDGAIEGGPEPGSTTEVGYWPLSAVLSASEDAVRVMVQLTNPGGATETFEWVDTEAGRFGGAGSVGLATYGVWSIEPRFDNLSIVGR